MSIILCILFAVCATLGFSQPAPDLSAGKKIFESQCSLCHGQTGGGGRGPALNRPKLSRAPDDEALRQVISGGIDPEMPGAWQLHPREVASVASYVRSLGALPAEIVPGDPSKGATVYSARKCAGCHMIAGVGEGFGPELTQIGARRSAAHLRSTILQPAASLPDGFLYAAATTVSGQTVLGIRINEDSFTIQLKDAGGVFHSFRKASLKELRRLEGQTPMPSYQGQLSAAELDDLVAYLASLKGKS
jgi:putative heme-binding domain-containing protein